ncbi:MAG: hypothetical protein ABI301_04375 [Jatrophihabitantaceae bacterium]
MDDDEPRPTAGPVVAAIAFGVAPLPLLAVYSVLFIVHGSIHPVAPPDITTTQHGELLAGLIALVLFIGLTLTLMWFLNRRRRWPFAIGQLATLVTSIDFVVDVTTGPPGIPVLLAVTSLIALVISLLPVSAEHVGHHPVGRRRARAAPDQVSSPS